MKHLIKYLFSVFVAAVLLGGAYFLWDYRQHYGDWGQSKDISQLLTEYNITPIDNVASTKVKPPVLPDLAPYTAQAVISKIPELKHGLVQVRNLEEGYRKMRNQLPFFGEKQDRLDPLSIVLSDGVYDLDALIEEVGDETLLTKRDDGVYILYVPLSIRSDATLIVKDNQELLLSVNTGGLISNFGNLYIVNAVVKGWNTEADKPAAYKDPESFRPHITSWCGSHLDIIGATLAHLG
ncbi:MAG TPA: hypothetical protein PK690_12540, partial [Emcibacteraceae bacterium]|nr:hypothetical protein [Emcibacteraceae bacterium]